MELLHRVKEVNNMREKVEQYHKLICYYLDSQMKMIHQLSILDHAMTIYESDKDTVSDDNLQFDIDDITVQPCDMVFTEMPNDELLDIPSQVSDIMPEPIVKAKKTTSLKNSSRARLPSRPVDFDISLKPQSLTDAIKIMPSYDDNIKIISTKKSVTYDVIPPQEDIFKGNATKKGAKAKRGRPKKT